MATTTNFVNHLASLVLAELKYYPRVRFRLFRTYAEGDYAHEANLLPNSCQPEIELALSERRGENKVFIESLINLLPIAWNEMSKQISLGYDQPGYEDTSTEFARRELVAALKKLEKVTLPVEEEHHTTPVRDAAALRQLVLDHYLPDRHKVTYTCCEVEEIDTELHFWMEMDEDKSTAQDYVYYQPRVHDAYDTLLAILHEDNAALGTWDGEDPTLLGFVSSVEDWLGFNLVELVNQERAAANQPSLLPGEPINYEANAAANASSKAELAAEVNTNLHEENSALWNAHNKLHAALEALDK